MFTATLLIIAKTWEQSRWMNELVHTDNEKVNKKLPAMKRQQIHITD